MASKVGVGLLCLGSVVAVGGIALFVSVGVIDHNNNGIPSNKGAGVLFGSLVTLFVAVLIIVAGAVVLDKNKKDQEVQQSRKDQEVHRTFKTKQQPALAK